MKHDGSCRLAGVFGGAMLLLSALIVVPFSPAMADAVRSQPEQEVMTYISTGYHDVKKEYVMRKYTPVVTYLNPYTQGEYRIEDYAQKQWDVSFDYDDVKDEFTLYDAHGVKRLHYSSEHAFEMEAEDQKGKDVKRSGTYSDENAEHIFRNAAGCTFPQYIAQALRIFRATDEYERGEIRELYQSAVPDGDGKKQPFLLEKNAVSKERAQEVYRSRWKMVAADDDDEWISFDYNPDTDYFTMYDPSDDTPYARRRFINNATQIDTIKYRDPGAETGIYNKGDDNRFEGPGGRILKFVTDGMLIFYTQLRQ